MDEAQTHFDYQGPPELREPLLEALRGVVDPEMALSIIDIGLVYSVRVDESGARVAMTMTSAACPMSDLIVEDVESALQRVLPGGAQVAVEMVWDPPWTPERMSDRARSFMGW